MCEAEFVADYKNGVVKGVFFASAQPYQTAKDVIIIDFYAGIFSYLLTQYLWQETGTPEQAIAYTNKQIPRRFNQNPLYEVETNSRSRNRGIYFA
ncbi:MAG: hypothetical protein QNJ68_10510 [Microcoleaceae cyanobacterium MO_207.B10]|nr:hypothetical protein [Microcoleaceae cyanobacterium MO_207.B10]